MYRWVLPLRKVEKDIDATSDMAPKTDDNGFSQNTDNRQKLTEKARRFATVTIQPRSQGLLGKSPGNEVE